MSYSQASLTPDLLPRAEDPLDFALRFTFSYGFTLVSLGFSTHQGDFNLVPAIPIRVNPDGNNSQPFLSHKAHDPEDLPLVKEKLPFPEGLVIVTAGRHERTNMHLPEPGFLSIDLDERIAQIDPAFPQRLDFRSKKHNTGLEFLEDLILMERFPVCGRRAAF